MVAAKKGGVSGFFTALLIPLDMPPVMDLVRHHKNPRHRPQQTTQKPLSSTSVDITKPLVTILRRHHTPPASDLGKHHKNPRHRPPPPPPQTSHKPWSPPSIDITQTPVTSLGRHHTPPVTGSVDITPPPSSRLASLKRRNGEI